jgi:type II secretion system protein G
MKATLARSFVYLGVGTLLLAIGFVLGRYRAGMQATYVSDASTLVWFTGINEALDRADVAEARKRTDEAVEANVGVLSSLGQNCYQNLIAFNSPWLAANEISISKTALAKTNHYYVNHDGRIDAATQRYLRRYTDSETRAELDLDVLAAKLRLYGAISKRLPTAEEGLDILVHKPPATVDRWYQLMQKLPLDPWGHAYQYRVVPDSALGYDLFSLGPDGVESPDDIHFKPDQQTDSSSK